MPKDFSGLAVMKRWTEMDSSQLGKLVCSLFVPNECHVEIFNSSCFLLDSWVSADSFFKGRPLTLSLSVLRVEIPDDKGMSPSMQCQAKPTSPLTFSSCKSPQKSFNFARTRASPRSSTYFVTSPLLFTSGILLLVTSFLPSSYPDNRIHSSDCTRSLLLSGTSNQPDHQGDEWRITLSGF